MHSIKSMEHIGSSQKLVESYGNLGKLKRAYRSFNNHIELIKENLGLVFTCTSTMFRYFMLLLLIPQFHVDNNLSNLIL